MAIVKRTKMILVLTITWLMMTVFLETTGPEPFGIGVPTSIGTPNTAFMKITQPNTEGQDNNPRV